MRDYNHPAFRSVHFGSSGIGKNTDFLPRLLKQSKKVKVAWVFDHKGEFAQKLKIEPVFTEAQLASATFQGGIVCFNYCEAFPGDREKAWGVFCRFVYQASAHIRGRKIFVGDELQEVASPTHDVRPFVTALDDGRSLKLDFMGIAQSPNGIHTRVRNQITETFVFRQGDATAAEWFKKKGIDEKIIFELRPGEFYWKNLNTGQIARGGKAFAPDSKGTPDGCVIVKRSDVEGGGGGNGGDGINSQISRAEPVPKNQGSDSVTRSG